MKSSDDTQRLSFQTLTLGQKQQPGRKEEAAKRGSIKQHRLTSGSLKLLDGMEDPNPGCQCPHEEAFRNT